MELRITREEIRQKLLDWQSSKISECDLKNWAEYLLDNGVKLEDWDSDWNSVSSEILHSLESLDMNLLIQLDIPIFLDFLKTDPNNFAAGFKILDQYFKRINYRQRQAVLKNNKFYSLYCDSKSCKCSD
ncbi:conserved hypothetical protein [Alphaproteobacteria bacterium]